MPHYDHVCVVRDYSDCVFKSFSFALAGVSGVREADYSCAQTVDCRFEGESGPCRRLEKETGDDLAREEILASVLLELFCDVEYVKNLFFRKILN